jgi:ParB family chromosome partitioning protein
MLEDGRLTLGHARALLPLEREQQMLTLAEEIATHGLSVREVERRVSTETPARRRPRPRTEHATATRQAEINQIEDQLRRRLQTDVRIALASGERGTIEIAFYSADDLDRVLDLIVGPGRELA